MMHLFCLYDTVCSQSLVLTVSCAVLQGKTTLDNGDTLTRDGNDGESDCIADRNAALEEQKVSDL